MAWKVSFDLDKFEEALDWFRARTPMPATTYYSLDAHARDKAFTVSHVAHMDTVQYVMDAIDRALEKGMDLRQFSKEVGTTLRSAWMGSVANPGHRIETIFRTNTASAFARGRQIQMDDPVISSIRPWRLFDDTRDARESDICRLLGGTVVRYDDPWLASHTPPLHHQCRTILRALREAQARRKPRWGEHPPAVSCAKRFGVKPDLTDTRTRRLKPDYNKYDGELAALGRKKEAAKRPKPKKPPGETKKRKGVRVPKPLKPGEQSEDMRKLDESLFVNSKNLDKRDNQRKTREASRDYLDKTFGIKTRDTGVGRDAVVIASDGLAAGYHHWDGTIALHPGVQRRLSGDSRVSRRVGQAALLHEELHGCSPAKPSAYDARWVRSGGKRKFVMGGGAIVEEVSTEVLARRAIVSGDGSYPEAMGPYRSEIGWMNKLVRKHTGVSEEEAKHKVIKASAKLKAADTPPCSTPDELITAWVDRLDATKAQRVKIREELQTAEVTT